MSQMQNETKTETDDWKQRVRDEFLRDDVKVLFGKNLPTVAEVKRLLAEEAYARTGKYRAAARMIGMNLTVLISLLQKDAGQKANLDKPHPMSLAMNNGPEKAMERLVLVTLAYVANDTGLGVCDLQRLAVLSRMKVRPLRAILVALERDGWIIRDQLVGNRYQINLEKIGA